MRYITKSTILLLALVLYASACKNDDENTEQFPDVPFDIAFYVVDSLNNLVFPSSGEFNSIYHPEDFYANSMFSSNIGMVSPHQEFGHVFRIRESTSTILNNADAWMQDSIIRFNFCFDNLCDSVIVYNPFYTDFASSAEWILWQGDTIYNYEINLLIYEINE